MRKEGWGKKAARGRRKMEAILFSAQRAKMESPIDGK